MTKKAFFYDQYLKTIGGGERYVFTLADYLLKIGWDVTIFNGDEKSIVKLKERFDLDLSKAQLMPMPLSLVKKWKMTKNADLFFWVSDGSIPLMFSKNNILHFQVPFHEVNGKSLLNQIKLKMIKSIVCNSEFTKRFIDKEYAINSEVIYPPIEVDSFKVNKKENIILSVGRFSKLLQAKRQDILINAFKEMVDVGLNGWKLQLAGSTDVGGLDYLMELKESAKNYPIEFYENRAFDIVTKLYSKAKIFWYAGGYGIDEEKEPEKTEHFGMTIVEAMASGCIPFVVPKGGIKETVEDKINGYYYNNIAELSKLTKELMLNSKIAEKLGKEVVQSSMKFDKKVFNQKYLDIIK
jgi:glycosyltransferase involved in cell wall biosynthesis